METAVTTVPAPDETEGEAVPVRLSEQMEEMRGQIQADDAGIALLKTELAELRAEACPASEGMQ